MWFAAFLLSIHRTDYPEFTKTHNPQAVQMDVAARRKRGYGPDAYKTYAKDRPQ